MAKQPKQITCSRCLERRPLWRNHLSQNYCRGCWETLQAGIAENGIRNRRIHSEP